jgi:hypothetical protein
MNTVSSLSNNATKKANNALKSITNVATTTVNSVSNFATNAAKTTNTALNSVSDFATNAVNAANSAVNSVSDFASNIATTTVNSVAPVANSIMQLSNNNKNSNKNSNNSNSNTNVFTNVTNANTANVSKNTNTSTNSSWTSVLFIFVMLIGIITLVLIVFKEQLTLAYDNLVIYLRTLFGLEVKDESESSNIPVTDSVETSNDVSYENKEASKSILEKILPFGKDEVFNVSSNEYTYYDAEPLCKALGAQLATYDQLKDSWEKGADWCNYGWTKGQVAVYPTQKSTWEKVQNGPEDERDACGQPGVNGGYFDNPEMRFGVNCYGKKPDQSTNDERVLMKNGSIPKTADGLKIDKQIRQYKEMADKLGLSPFNTDTWSSPI